MGHSQIGTAADRGWERIMIAFCRNSGSVVCSAEIISAIDLPF